MGMQKKCLHTLSGSVRHCPVSTSNQPEAQGKAPNYEAALTAAFGSHCGLNADWSVSAWCVCSTAGRNGGVGLYITDDEDGNLTLYRRDFSKEGIEGIDTQPYSEVAALINEAKTRRDAMKVANEAARRVFDEPAKVPEGWADVSTGGGCNAWSKESGCGVCFMITDGDSQCPTDASEPCGLILYNEGNQVCFWDCTCLAQALEIANSAKY
jgi:hypothetical protein